MKEVEMERGQHPPYKFTKERHGFLAYDDSQSFRHVLIEYIQAFRTLGQFLQKLGTAL